ncbi:hypothetical protein L195_g056972, partial [Trifolium pratense]
DFTKERNKNDRVDQENATAPALKVVESVEGG